MPTIEDVLHEFIEKSILFSSDGLNYDEDTSFLENNILDSTSIVELVSFVEEKFDISVEDPEIIPSNFDSIRNLSAYIKRKIPPKTK